MSSNSSVNILSFFECSCIRFITTHQMPLLYMALLDFFATTGNMPRYSCQLHGERVWMNEDHVEEATMASCDLSLSGGF